MKNCKYLNYLLNGKYKYLHNMPRDIFDLNKSVIQDTNHKCA